MNDTPETDKEWGNWLHKLKMPIESFVDFARKLERERNEALDSLKFIAEWGGKTHETECGDIRCDGGWCAEQARSAIYLLKENQ
jgi:hypothetical protein